MQFPPPPLLYLEWMLFLLTGEWLHHMLSGLLHMINCNLQSDTGISPATCLSQFTDITLYQSALGMCFRVTMPHPDFVWQIGLDFRFIVWTQEMAYVTLHEPAPKKQKNKKMQHSKQARAKCFHMQIPDGCVLLQTVSHISHVCQGKECRYASVWYGGDFLYHCCMTQMIYPDM